MALIGSPGQVSGTQRFYVEQECDGDGLCTPTAEQLVAACSPTDLVRQVVTTPAGTTMLEFACKELR